MKITWVNDGSNDNCRRMYVDGVQWAKVYGMDWEQLNARCDALQAALSPGDNLGYDRNMSSSSALDQALSRRVMPAEAVPYDMVGCAPMAAPTGKIFALRGALKSSPK